MLTAVNAAATVNTTETALQTTAVIIVSSFKLVPCFHIGQGLLPEISELRPPHRQGGSDQYNKGAADSKDEPPRFFLP